MTDFTETALPVSETAEVFTSVDVMDPARSAALQVALGLQPDITAGAELPPFFHQLYFWTPVPPQDLGRDGHPGFSKTGLIPDLGLPRRMWAGGRLRFQHPLRAGIEAVKRSTVEHSERKRGRTGPLGFVTLRHDIYQDGQLCLSEWHDLVYREDPSADAPKPVPPQARRDEAVARQVSFSSTLLFRYSALTFNGHRIHYDLDYARDVEGYAGLVVHGPLLAQQLMLLAQELLGPLAEFSFRATAPLMHFEAATLCCKGQDLWVRAPDGRQCMQAQALPRG
jgi:3-methylfumaryl-CoA hydratase